jgi:uncharacterized membrane protein
VNHSSASEPDQNVGTARNANNHTRGVLVSYTLELMALAVWIGGLVIIVAAVIPAVFNSFGMEPGGRFLTRVFEGYNRTILMASVILLLSAGYRTVLSRGAQLDMSLSRLEWMVTIIMIVMAAAIIFVLEPSSVRLQEAAFAIKDEVARKAAYESFFKSHTLVRALYVVNLGLALALIPMKLTSWLRCKKVLS